MIKLKNVSKIYKNGTRALNNVSLHIESGEFVYIIGRTGAGKSTLIKILHGEEVPTSGDVMVSGMNVGKLKKSKVYVHRRNIGVVFQDFELLPEKTVFENIAYALEVVDTPKEKIVKRVREVLKLVDLSDKASQFPRHLSGGQIQRVAIARAIANKPKLLIADEPTGNLDSETSDDIIKLFERINEEEKTTVLIVTHDLLSVQKHPKRTIEINHGTVVNDAYDMLRGEKVTHNMDADEFLYQTQRIRTNSQENKENVQNVDTSDNESQENVSQMIASIIDEDKEVKDVH